MLPVVAIVGRPNVGKSSLFNRIAGKRISIVDPTPGVTRDRVSTVVTVPPPPDADEDAAPRAAELFDTGGYGIYTAEGKSLDDAGRDLGALTPEIERQILSAVEGASVILFTVDAQSGITSLDETIATLLRRGGQADKAILIVNKVDGPSWEAHALEATRLGFGDPVMVSANAGVGIRPLLEAVWTRLSSLPEIAEPPDAEMKLAIVGRRNSGKSSIVNALAGGERVIVSEIAGTTRDSVDVRFESGGRSFLAIDTAGVRKRSKYADDVEWYSQARTQNAIRRCDVAFLLLDATEKVSQVEKHLASELTDQFKPVVIVLNKWDLLPKGSSAEDFAEYISQELPGLDFAPIVCVSAVTGEGVQDAVAMAFNLHTQAGHRETTGKLNAVIRAVLAERGPSSRLGTTAKIFYVSQIATKPPTIAVVVNKPKLFEGGYERYLLNRMREELPFAEVPIKLVFSERRRRDLSQGAPSGRARDAGPAEPEREEFES